MSQGRVDDGRKRAVIDRVRPELEGGRYPIKRAAGETVGVEADVYVDGHDRVAAVVQYRPVGQTEWFEVPLLPLGNDRWEGVFSVEQVGRYAYRVAAWLDYFGTWRHDLVRREDLDDVAAAVLTGADMAEEAAGRAGHDDGARLREWARTLRHTSSAEAGRETALQEEFALLMARYPDRSLETIYERELEIVVDRERARFSSWYEFFPRSFGDSGAGHGTFRDCHGMLEYVAEMGFDVVYLPPIHPIGRVNRKGRNNALVPGPGDPGSPWAIGAAEGGHKSIHPQLGNLDDFRRFVARAHELGLEIALDVAFQCAPDHPYVTEHPEWFRRRPDGRIQYAENPPKKYEDIYPFYFESDDWRTLWEELKRVFLFWIDQGVYIFRVDNPHTKPFGFWEWVIGEIKRDYPEVIFLAEAFARPKVMYGLAKLGFSQSYTYFAWRNTKWELTEYFTALTQTQVREFYRPNLWPNTPDILTEQLQFGGRPAFMARLVLAATLGASYGIYGPAFELGEHEPREMGSEEYLDSEKYQLRHWDLNRPDSLRNFIARVNRIRRDNPALQGDWHLRFHAVDNEQLICYSKRTNDGTNIILVVVNLDVYHTQSGWVELPLDEFGMDGHQPYQMHDLVGGGRYLWSGSRNYVELNPHAAPAQIFCIRRRVRTERDFEYFF